MAVGMGEEVLWLSFVSFSQRLSCRWAGYIYLHVCGPFSSNLCDWIEMSSKVGNGHIE